jgi:hypothetical protein
MEQDLAKSLVDLIDQTIAEIEELKKSDRFQAAEIKIEGPGEGIAGKDPQGQLDAKKAEAFEGKETPEEEKEEEEEKKKKKAAMEKGVLDEAEVEKADDDEEDEDEEEVDKAEKKAEVEGVPYAMKKSQDEMDSLMKSMIDERVKPLESKIDSILNLIKEIADAPVTAKAVSYRDVTPLAKSEEEVTPLNKSEVSSKLWELKKSGTKVDTMDITQAELGSLATLQKIVAKYNIK